MSGWSIQLAYCQLSTTLHLFFCWGETLALDAVNSGSAAAEMDRTFMKAGCTTIKKIKAFVIGRLCTLVILLSMRYSEIMEVQPWMVICN